ncbi:MAG: CarD family transcriptional regulator [Xanthobacteraceae bacterium]
MKATKAYSLAAKAQKSGSPPKKATGKRASVGQSKNTPAKTTSAAKKRSIMTKNSAKTTAKTPSKASAKAPAKTAVSKAPAAKTAAHAAAPKTMPKATAAKPVAPKAAPKAAASVKPAAKPVSVKAVPVKPAAVKPAPHPQKSVAAKPAASPRPEEAKKPLTQRQGFKTNEFVVYPAHGVGQILAIEEQEIAGARLELFVISFMKDKMTLRVPTAKVANVGMRKLSEPALVKKALETLRGRARIKRTMWSRRAQEYEAKINSGDIVAIAEVVRDLYRSEMQPEQSYSERQLYEAALDRLSREIVVVQHMTETEAIKEIEAQLAKSPRRGAKAESDADADADDAAGEDGVVTDEAA